MCNNDYFFGWIFLLLDPIDLLHLARTTKALRAFLLNPRKSSGLWETAISNVEDFPPCPDHLSAPEYTHLAFVPVCHVGRMCVASISELINLGCRDASVPVRRLNGNCECDAVRAVFQRCSYTLLLQTSISTACLQDNTSVLHKSIICFSRRLFKWLEASICPRALQVAR